MNKQINSKIVQTYSNNIQADSNDVQADSNHNKHSNCCSNSCFGDENCIWKNILNLLKCWTWTCNSH